VSSDIRSGNCSSEGHSLQSPLGTYCRTIPGGTERLTVTKRFVKTRRRRSRSAYSARRPEKERTRAIGERAKVISKAVERENKGSSWSRHERRKRGPHGLERRSEKYKGLFGGRAVDVWIGTGHIEPIGDERRGRILAVLNWTVK